MNLTVCMAVGRMPVPTPNSPTVVGGDNNLLIRDRMALAGPKQFGARAGSWLQNIMISGGHRLGGVWPLRSPRV